MNDYLRSIQDSPYPQSAAVILYQQTDGVSQSKIVRPTMATGNDETYRALLDSQNSNSILSQGPYQHFLLCCLVELRVKSRNFQAPQCSSEGH